MKQLGEEVLKFVERVPSRVQIPSLPDQSWKDTGGELVDEELRRLDPPFSGPSSVCPSYTLYTHTSVPREVHW